MIRRTAADIRNYIPLLSCAQQPQFLSFFFQLLSFTQTKLDSVVVRMGCGGFLYLGGGGETTTSLQER